MQDQVYDITAQFDQHFMLVNDSGVKRPRIFATWDSIQAELCAFSRETYTNWSVRHSITADETFLVRRYQCRFAGFASRPPAGIRASSTCSTNCPAEFTISRRRRGVQGGMPVFIIRKTYNMRHNHPLNRLEYRLAPTQRRLSDTEERQISSLIRNYAAPVAVADYVLEHFGKVVTSQDIANMRWRLNGKMNNPGKCLYIHLN